MKFNILFFLFFFQFIYSQETKNENLVKFNHDIRFNALVPLNFGDNFLNKSYDTYVGAGTNFSFLRIDNFKLGVGYDFIQYTKSDITRTGNINGAALHAFYGDVSYEINVLEKLNIEPYFGFGGAELKFRSSGRNFGKQTGNNFRIGFNTDYKLAKRLSAFVGICYSHYNLDINTSPEFVSFYDNAKMIQINIGLKIH